MFTICGDKTEFNQWDLNQRVTDPTLAVGDKVVFVNSNGFCYPMKAYCNGTEIVADVPNTLMTLVSSVLVYVSGRPETKTSIPVVAHEKPDGYIFVDNVRDVPEVSNFTMIDITPYLAGMMENRSTIITKQMHDVFVTAYNKKNIMFYVPMESGEQVLIPIAYNHYDTLYSFEIPMLGQGTFSRLAVHGNFTNTGGAYVEPEVSISIHTIGSDAE